MHAELNRAFTPGAVVGVVVGRRQADPGGQRLVGKNPI